MIVLILGGAASGKSEMGESIASDMAEPVTFLATGSASDPEMADRISRHRARRPRGWETVELGPGADLVGALQDLRGTVLVDSVGTWLAGQAGFEADRARLARCLERRLGDTVVVSEEVGLGIHPTSQAGRDFRDRLGELNRCLSGVADRALLVVAGRALVLGGGTSGNA